MVKQLRDYIENLCRQHVSIRHSDEECHFVDLNNDHLETALADKMRYPGVFFEASGYTLRGEGASIIKYANVRIEVWKHVTDTADYDQIEEVLDSCGEILTDFFSKMIIDRRERKLRFLLGLSLDGVQVDDIMNVKNALYGVRATLQVPESQCLADVSDKFIP